MSLPLRREVQALVRIRPDCKWFALSLVPSHASAYVGSVSDHRAENGTTEYPESLCLILALPPSGRREPPPARTLLPGPSSYRLIRRSRSALLSFGLSLVRGVSAGCYQPLLPAGPSRRYLCESFPACLGPCHGGSRGVHLPVSSSTSSAFPRTLSRSASRVSPSKRFHDGSPFRDCSHFVMFRPSGLLDRDRARARRP